MKKPQILKWLISALLVLAICSCTKDIDLNQKYKKKIVVNCILTTDSIQTLSLTYSKPLHQYYYDEVETATVRLYLDSSEIGHFKKTAYGKWKINYKPVFGGNYKLKVEIPKWPLIEASTRMPLPVGIEKNHGNRTKRYFTQQYAPSPYWIMILSQRKDTVMIHPKILSGDRLLTSVGTNHPNRDGFNTTDDIAINNEGTTRENLTYIRINTPEENIKKKVPFFLEAHLNQSVIVFRSASQEYDQYMKSSVQKMMVYHVFDDPTQRFDENEIFTNINNGLGIFAACSDRIIQCHYSMD